MPAPVITIWPKGSDFTKDLLYSVLLALGGGMDDIEQIYKDTGDDLLYAILKKIANGGGGGGGGDTTLQQAIDNSNELNKDNQIEVAGFELQFLNAIRFVFSTISGAIFDFGENGDLAITGNSGGTQITFAIDADGTMRSWGNTGGSNFEKFISQQDGDTVFKTKNNDVVYTAVHINPNGTVEFYVNDGTTTAFKAIEIPSPFGGIDVYTRDADNNANNTFRAENFAAKFGGAIWQNTKTVGEAQTYEIKKEDFYINFVAGFDANNIDLMQHDENGRVLILCNKTDAASEYISFTPKNIGGQDVTHLPAKTMHYLRLINGQWFVEQTININGGNGTYKVITGLITQDGTNDPTLEIFENTTGCSLLTEYRSTGVFRINMSIAGSNATPSTKFWYNATPNLGTTTAKELRIVMSLINNVGVDIETILDGSSSNNALVNTPFEIRFYP